MSNILRAEETESMREHLACIMGYGSNKCAAFIQTLHPTRQQDVIRLMNEVMCIYAGNTMVDGRNEAAKELCEEVKELRRVLPVI